MTDAELTGKFIEAILAALGTLGLLVYRDVIRRIEGYHKDNKEQIETLHKDNRRRGRIQRHMQSYQRLICNKMGIEYDDRVDDNDD